MSKQHQKPIVNQQYSPQVPTSFRNDDEIDLRELFGVLWEGKFVIAISMIIFIVVALGYALSKAKIYEASVEFIVENRFYNSAVSDEEFIPQELIVSEWFKSKLVEYSKGDDAFLRRISLSYDKRSELYVLTNSSTDPEITFDGLKKASAMLNTTLKQHELEKVNSALEALQSSSLEASVIPAKTKEYLDELLAQLLSQKIILETPSTKLVLLLNDPKKPETHSSPKRALIAVLGTLLGGMLGVAIVLVRFAFRREEDVQ